jgi:hypothetical protein
LVGSGRLEMRFDAPLKGTDVGAINTDGDRIAKPRRLGPRRRHAQDHQAVVARRRSKPRLLEAADVVGHQQDRTRHGFPRHSRCGKCDGRRGILAVDRHQSGSKRGKKWLE